ncbi:hypothetical protein A2865_00125 [Candidatus Woesebacteria bacterium RIFCSPHIGHO2_01_FULL_39_17]|uniref:Uncharacterized protein n=3 Tax=Candidatus Woeseibacteriota TaxID=1752722 RepID=A0A0G0QVC3_9BACT|nr:MAG: hypothetical protein US72_C0005G0031 [Microgenomates group bacterium GW2011_GWC1_38_12]KKQ94226.1 MAG: hypothetical protein UT19_C0003G0031 [Candidatus Woesebacteria bacterium GW2011_GWB1_39_10b]KKR14290.1 MAG: hypothetical protein UT40_C0003G0032 [Candidatus Woesebacteria bacterium GW2011_GWA1_39_21b]OGM23638.1 MAG: hypothetical protein A2865_00125 [Candidatus Woesebacteria bacterium RIFCSPHIGHO2_01_FULL_39_17]OGM65461.1 MAG: hypothetical protein A3A52_00865 [Candidatus Woesebacteria b
MKIIVLHGDNTLESYERLLTFIKEAKKRGWDVKRITSARSIPEALVVDSLFEKEKLVVVENITFLGAVVRKFMKLKADKLDTTLIIYHPGTITETFINSLPKVDKVEEFKLPKLIWSFLDSFYPRNARNSLLLLHEIVKTQPLEFVFSLLAKQVRDLYWIKVDSKSMTYPEWRIVKLKVQANKFTNLQLTNLISLLAEADVRSKTSQGNLSDLLDFIIATKLE